MNLRLSSSLLLILLVACGPDTADHAEGDDDQDHGHGAHEAPHGGTLVELGEHFAHVEFLLDKETGRLQAWTLDGEADRPIRLSQKTLRLSIECRGVQTVVELVAQANARTGETVGDTGRFETVVESLKGAETFTGRVLDISILGRTMRDVEFSYPEGNEE